MTFRDWLAKELGTHNWCVAKRRSKATARYDVVLTPLRFAYLKKAYSFLYE